MKIVVLGATGGIGHELVVQALAAGHDVKAVARIPGDITIHHEQLQVLQGDVMHLESLAPAIANSDVVLSALGIRGFRNNLKPTTFYSQSTKHILQAMQMHQVRRLVVTTSEGVAENPSKLLLYRWIVRPLLKPSYTDMARMEAEINASGLDWTIIRPGRLTNGVRTGNYRVAVNRYVQKPRGIARADVADFMLRTVVDDQYIGAIVDVAR